MPGEPYFHGDEDFFAQDGVLLAVRVAHRNVHGVPCGATIKILTLDRRYSLGYYAERFDGTPIAAICWRTARGDYLTPITLDALIERCHDVFGARPRYRLGERTFDHHKKEIPVGT